MIHSAPDVRHSRNFQGIFMPSLFAPIKLGNVEFSNRIVVSPMCQYSADDGSANDWHLGHLGMLANSGAALVLGAAARAVRRGRTTQRCCRPYSGPHTAAIAPAIAPW